MNSVDIRWQQRSLNSLDEAIALAHELESNGAWPSPGSIDADPRWLFLYCECFGKSQSTLVGTNDSATIGALCLHSHPNRFDISLGPARLRWLRVRQYELKPQAIPGDSGQAPSAKTA